MNERPIPNAAILDPNSIEMIRVWIAQKGLHCSIKVGMYKEIQKTPEAQAWGIILADITRHIAAALNEKYGDEVINTVGSIKASFDKELLRPTSPTAGGFVEKK